MSGRAQFPDEQSQDGAFARQDDAFRDRVSPEPSARFAVAAGRYHLYVSLACPWAHRTIIVRALLGLEDAIGMTVVDPLRDDKGWAFREVAGASRDALNGFEYLSEAYRATDAAYRGRVTVPVLWDTVERGIVSNSDDDIMRMFETSFLPLAKCSHDFVPANLLPQIDELNTYVYQHVNNGVYRAGFATTQQSYTDAVRDVFGALDVLEARLASHRFLFGDTYTETDWRLFVTLVRFDAVYVGHFKCNIRRIADYPHLQRYLHELYHVPRVAETVNFAHIKRHYYMTHDEINPTRIVPSGPDLSGLLQG